MGSVGFPVGATPEGRAASRRRARLRRGAQGLRAGCVPERACCVRGNLRGGASLLAAVALILQGRGRYGGGFRAVRVPTTWLIVAEDKNANPAGFTLAPFFIRCELQARFSEVAEVL